MSESRGGEEGGAAGAQLEVFLVWLDKSKMFVPTPPLPDCLPLPLCVRGASAQARTLRGFTFYWTGGKTRQDFCPVSCHGPKNTEGRTAVPVSPDLLTLPWKVFTKTPFKHLKCVLFDKNTKTCRHNF